MSSFHPRCVLNLRGIVHALEQATGVRRGWPTNADYARYHHVIEFDGLCRQTLGDTRFRAAYSAVRGEAVRIAPLAFLVEPIRDARRVVTGYEFAFADEATAVAFRDGALEAMRARGVA